MSGSFGEIRPHFAGAEVNNRMDLVRRAINDIRENWELYPQFMRELRDFMEDSDHDLYGQGDDKRLRTLFSSNKEWFDPVTSSLNSDPDYSAVRLYTSQCGYDKMFATINRAFRSTGLVDDNLRLQLRCATFLVELLNIDLFNYRARNKEADNFEGRVYRGMHISAADLEWFTNIARGPVAERYVGIPLAMASASREREIALAFALEGSSGLRESMMAAGQHLILWDIKVYGIDPELLAIYHDIFPTSVVTSLCAVPINQLSDYPEGEVLLRGPFFQIIRVRQEDADIALGPLHVIEAVMLNSNRDHISAKASNEGDDERARKLFRAIVTIQRSMICAQHAEGYGLAADADSYRSMVSENRSAIPGLIEE